MADSVYNCIAKALLYLMCKILHLKLEKIICVVDEII